MKKPITQRDIAEACGVERTTVSGILDPKKRVQFNPDTAAKVLETAGKLGYRPDLAAQLMRGKKSGTIGIISSAGLVQPSLEKLLFASDEIRKAGYGIVSGELLSSDSAFGHAVDNMLDVRAEGVILAGLQFENGRHHIQRLREAGVPIVSLGGTPVQDVPWVSADYYRAMRDLTNHLISRGCGRLVHVTTATSGAGEKKVGSLQERVLGFQNAAEAAGLDQSRASVLHGEAPEVCPNEYEVARSAMERILGQRDRPDAILCWNDNAALVALFACMAAGLRVPQDIAVTGFDNTDMAGCTVPGLTSVAQPSEACARKAVELLIRMLQGESLDSSESEQRLPCEIVVREST